MDTDAQLLYEARNRSRMAAVALGGGVLLVAASAIALAGPHTTVDELTLDLITANKRFPLDLIAAVVNGVASVLIAWTLVFLYRCARARNPDSVKPFIKWVAIAGGGAGRGRRGRLRDRGGDQGPRVRDHRCADLRRGQPPDQLPGLLGLQLVGQAAALLLAVAFVLVSLNALRVGLLTRFMGYLGIFAGVLVLFQIIQIPVVQGYWLAAVAYLLSGRWPSGVPPAWRTGRAEPWPSSAEVRARRAAGSGGGGLGRGRGSAAPAPEPQPAGAPAPTSNGRTRANTPKRKRKRRG